MADANNDTETQLTETKDENTAIRAEQQIGQRGGAFTVMLPEDLWSAVLLRWLYAGNPGCFKRDFWISFVWLALLFVITIQVLLTIAFVQDSLTNSTDPTTSQTASARRNEDPLLATGIVLALSTLASRVVMQIRQIIDASKWISWFKVERKWQCDPYGLRVQKNGSGECFSPHDSYYLTWWEVALHYIFSVTLRLFLIGLVFLLGSQQAVSSCSVVSALGNAVFAFFILEIPDIFYPVIVQGNLKKIVQPDSPEIVWGAVGKTDGTAARTWIMDRFPFLIGFFVAIPLLILVSFYVPHLLHAIDPLSFRSDPLCLP